MLVIFSIATIWFMTRLQLHQQDVITAKEISRTAINYICIVLAIVMAYAFLIPLKFKD